MLHIQPRKVLRYEIMRIVRGSTRKHERDYSRPRRDVSVLKYLDWELGIDNLSEMCNNLIRTGLSTAGVTQSGYETVALQGLTAQLEIHGQAKQCLAYKNRLPEKAIASDGARSFTSVSRRSTHCKSKAVNGSPMNSSL